MPVYRNPVKRQFTWASTSYLTIFCYYTRSLTPQEFLPSLPIQLTHHFSGTVLAFYYTDYYSCHYTSIVQRRCSVLHTSAHGVIAFCLYHMYRSALHTFIHDCLVFGRGPYRLRSSWRTLLASLAHELHCTHDAVHFEDRTFCNSRLLICNDTRKIAGTSRKTLPAHKFSMRH